MSHEDFFQPFDDKTRIVRPSPGRRDAPDISPSYTPPPADSMPVNLDLARLSGENQLLAEALPLLSLVSSLGNTVDHADVGGLRRRLIGEIEKFNDALSRKAVTSEPIWKATYALCSLLDETIQKTPWGVRSGWAKQSLSILFRKDSWGGEGFFDIVDQIIRQPQQNACLVALYYLCLSLGFEGKYINMPNGLNALEKYRTELYMLIQRQREGEGRELSLRWQGLHDTRHPLMRETPVWVLAAVSGSILILAYMAFFFSIGSEASRQSLAALRSEGFKLAGPQLPVIAKPLERGDRFKDLSQNENVEVVGDYNLRVRNSFEKGSALVKPDFLALLQKVAGELGAGQGTVLVTGHTDSSPIRKNFIFPSNLELSEARAKNVADILLANPALSGRVKWKGKASDEPLASNDSPENRARNRRVEFLIIR